jgi:hypothetical protein
VPVNANAAGTEYHDARLQTGDALVAPLESQVAGQSRLITQAVSR